MESQSLPRLEQIDVNKAARVGKSSITTWRMG